MDQEEGDTETQNEGGENADTSQQDDASELATPAATEANTTATDAPEEKKKGRY